MKRTGPRGGGQWQRISWDEALDEMTDRLLAVREEHGPLSLCGAVSNAHFSRGVSLALMMRALGSPNWMMNQDLCGGCRALSDKITGLGIKETMEGVGALAKGLRVAFTGDDPLTAEQKAELRGQALQLEGLIEQAISKVDKVRGNIIIAEAQGGSWLQRNWRPVTMLVFVAIIANNYILFPYLSLLGGPAVKLEIPPDMWGLLKLGIGGYIVGRSAEKGVAAWKRKTE